MSTQRERARWRGFSAAVLLTVIAALMGGIAGPAAAAVAPPAPVANTAAVTPQSVPDDEDEFNRQLVEDIAAHASEPEVRQAAQEALDSHDPAKILYFLDHGEAEAKAKAAERKRAEAAHNRELVQGWAQTGGPKVRAGAQAALDSGDDQKIADFVQYGHEIAEKQDQQDEVDAQAERERVIGRVKDMVAHGGPQVQVEGAAVLSTNDYDRIRAFYLTGYADANKRDHDFQAVIEKALADRNKAVNDLIDLARRAGAAAQARAEILRANIEAVQALDNATLAMKLGASFAHRADEIVQEDKPGRAHGQLGRTAEIDSLRAQATQQAEAAARAALSARGTTAAVQNAAVDLLHTGMTNGLDWAKVTIAIGSAVEAASKATETAQHAAEATLADSRALDADNKAEEHAANAKKWREEAERQAQTAADLATAAKQQQDIAIGARDRAKAQQAAAEAAAAQARQHAAKARAARVNAQGAAGNAVAKSNAAVSANNDAIRDKVREDTAIEAAGRTATELKTATSISSDRATYAQEIEAALKAARDQAIKEGKDADAATKDIAADAARARSAANESAAWAARARAAAATAKAEADAASAAARRSRAAAAAADQEAVTARRAADDANQLAMQAASVAAGAQSSADQTRFEAEGAVTEANQAVFQAQVADRAANAASASASMVIDPAHSAEIIAKPYANLNGDARQAMAVAVDALQLSQQLAKSAQDRATEANQAADRAKKAADAAIADVKPAYDAAARAAQSAQQAAQYAVGAVDAANAAAGYAHNAHVAATNATNAASAARSDAAVAGRAASVATNAAYTAGRAAASAEAIKQWAENATNAINNFRTELVQAFDKFQDEKAKAIEAERLAREQAEQKRQQLNKEFLGGLFTGAMCLMASTSLPCQELQRQLTGKVLEGIGAAAGYVKDDIQCVAGDQAACQRFNEATQKIRDFMQKALDGFVESAKGFWEGLKGIGNCIVQGVSAGGGPACDQIGAGIKDLIANPYKLIHLDVWHDDPGKALGMTTFDVLTVVATIPLGGSGSAVGKLVEALTSVVGKAATTLINGLGKIAEVAAKVIDRTTGKIADSLADIVGLTVKIENGIAKVEAWNVLFDGNVFKLKPFEVQVTGDLSKLEGAIARIEGGTITFEGDVAKLEGATFRFDPAPEGTKPPTFPTSSEWDGKNWIGKEYGQEFKLDAAGYEKSKELLAHAEKSAETIKPKIEQVARDVDGSRLEGLQYQLKGADSLRRKLATEVAAAGGDLAKAAGEINDAVRYTLVLPESGYTAGVKAAVERLQAQGFQVTKLKNFWSRNQNSLGYRGINLTVYDDATKQVFEFQLHTEDSLLAKEAEHDWYNWRRVPDVPQIEIDYAQAQSDAIFGSVRFPDRAVDITLKDGKVVVGSE
ncbi:hypothetical protein [Kutzneria sp. NPDC052558]|uniref:hypothetical protein n=1 Tax=Kutzneria sp. NPDC052558 TaxID=3364121 RepID=UPI0037C70742